MGNIQKGKHQNDIFLDIKVSITFFSFYMCLNFSTLNIFIMHVILDKKVISLLTELNNPCVNKYIRAGFRIVIGVLFFYTWTEVIAINASLSLCGHYPHWGLAENFYVKVNFIFNREF